MDRPPRLISGAVTGSYVHAYFSQIVLAYLPKTYSAKTNNTRPILNIEERILYLCFSTPRTTVYSAVEPFSAKKKSTAATATVLWADVSVRPIHPQGVANGVFV